MNCPMCGASLGDGDQMCASCGTKRSEMGPAYNRPAQPVQQNSYGGNMGSGGNSGNYGNVGEYGFGMGSGGNFGGGTNGSSNSWLTPDLSRGGYMRYREHRPIIAIAIIVMLFVGIFVGNLQNNREYTQDMGAFSITFPQRMKKDTSSAFVDPSEDGVVYSGRNVGFAYMEYDLSEFGLEGSDVIGFEDEFLEDLEAEFEKGLSGYRLKDKMNGYLRFYFTDTGTKYFTAVRVEVHGDNMYMFVANCEEKDQGKYGRKIMDMLGSIKYN